MNLSAILFAALTGIITPIIGYFFYRFKKMGEKVDAHSIEIVRLEGKLVDEEKVRLLLQETVKPLVKNQDRQEETLLRISDLISSIKDQIVDLAAK